MEMIFSRWKAIRGLTLVLAYYLGGMSSADLENSNEGKNELNDKQN